VHRLANGMGRIARASQSLMGWRQQTSRLILSNSTCCVKRPGPWSAMRSVNAVGQQFLAGRLQASGPLTGMGFVLEGELSRTHRTWLVRSHRRLRQGREKATGLGSERRGWRLYEGDRSFKKGTEWRIRQQYPEARLSHAGGTFRCARTARRRSEAWRHDSRLSQSEASPPVEGEWPQRLHPVRAIHQTDAAEQGP
jgi:hypothetical protein